MHFGCRKLWLDFTVLEGSLQSSDEEKLSKLLLLLSFSLFSGEGGYFLYLHFECFPFPGLLLENSKHQALAFIINDNSQLFGRILPGVMISTVGLMLSFLARNVTHSLIATSTWYCKSSQESMAEEVICPIR